MRISAKKTAEASRKPAVPEHAETAAYIAEMAAGLAKLAGDAQLPMLAYFLNLARVEAQIYLRENDPRAAERDK